MEYDTALWRLVEKEINTNGSTSVRVLAVDCVAVVLMLYMYRKREQHTQD